MFAMLLVLATAGGSAPSDTTWCAPPRPAEPLLLDAHFLPARGQGRTGPDSEYINLAGLLGTGIHRVPEDSIAVVRDETVCHNIAKQLFRMPVPVFIVRVGRFFLVDDQHSRDAPHPFWEVMIFDEHWKGVTSYGEGQ